MGRALMDIGTDVAGTIERSNQAEEDKLTQEYLQMIQRGQNPEEVEQMEEPGVIGKTFGAKAKPRKINHKALMNAYFQAYKLKMQDTNYRNAKLELATNESRHAKQAAVDAFAQYNGALKGGDMKSADQIAVQIYNSYPNGETLEVDQDTGKIYKMKADNDGQLVRGEETKLPTRDKIAELMKGIMEGRAFEESYVGQLQSNEIANWQAKMEAERVVDKDGNFVGYMAKVVDPKTGKPDWQFSSNSTDNTQPWIEARQSGLQLESKYLGTKGKKATIAETKSKTYTRLAKDKREAKGIPAKNAAPELKLAVAITKTMPGVTVEEAMEHVLNSKGQDKKIAAVLKMLEERHMSLESPKVQQAIKAMDLEHIFGGSGEGTGLRGGIENVRRKKAARKSAASETKKERVRTGGGITGQTQADFTEAQLKEMRAEAQKLRNEGKSKAEIAQILRNKYSK
jgi:hypothetical protein